MSRLTPERWLEAKIRRSLWTGKEQDRIPHFDIADYNAIRGDPFPTTLQRGLTNPTTTFQQCTLGAAKHNVTSSRSHKESSPRGPSYLLP